MSTNKNTDISIFKSDIITWLNFMIVAKYNFKLVKNNLENLFVIT